MVCHAACRGEKPSAGVCPRLIGANFHSCCHFPTAFSTELALCSFPNGVLRFHERAGSWHYSSQTQSSALGPTLRHPSETHALPVHICAWTALERPGVRPPPPSLPPFLISQRRQQARLGPAAQAWTSGKKRVGSHG